MSKIYSYTSLMILLMIFTYAHADCPVDYQGCICQQQSSGWLINCAKGQLSAVPSLQPEWHNITIEQLTLSNNLLTWFNYTTYRNTTITKLFLRANNLSTLEFLAEPLFRSLTYLYLSSNTISVFTGLETLQSLELLDITAVGLKSLSQIPGLKNLKILRAGSNRIRSVGAGDLINMTSLEELELSRSHIESLDFLHHPDMATIKTLSLSNNQIAMITEEDFRHLSSVENLRLQNNHLTTLIDISFLTNLKILIWYGNPVECDCRLSWLSAWLQSYDGQYEENPSLATCLPRTDPHFNCSRSYLTSSPTPSITSRTNPTRASNEDEENETGKTTTGVSDDTESEKPESGTRGRNDLAILLSSILAIAGLLILLLALWRFCFRDRWRSKENRSKTSVYNASNASGGDEFSFQMPRQTSSTEEYASVLPNLKYLRDGTDRYSTTSSGYTEIREMPGTPQSSKRGYTQSSIQGFSPGSSQGWSPRHIQGSGRDSTTDLRASSTRSGYLIPISHSGGQNNYEHLRQQSEAPRGNYTGLLNPYATQDQAVGGEEAYSYVSFDPSYASLSEYILPDVKPENNHKAEQTGASGQWLVNSDGYINMTGSQAMDHTPTDT